MHVVFLLLLIACENRMSVQNMQKKHIPDIVLSMPNGANGTAHSEYMRQWLSSLCCCISCQNFFLRFLVYRK